MIFLILVAIQMVVFGALIFFLKNILQRHYGKASSHLDSLNQETERRLTEAKQKSEEANAYYEQMIASAKTDAIKLKQQLNDEGLKERQDLIDRARDEADEIMERARSARKLLEENWQSEVARQAREFSLKALRQTLPSRMTQDIQNEWMRKTLESGMEGLEHLNISGDVFLVKVASALILTDSQKKEILAKLKEKTKRDFEIEESIDPTLILGFRMELGSVVIDGSLSWKLKEVLQNAGSK